MDVICLGQITADVVVNWTREIPDRGKSKFVKRIQLNNGGCACNTAIDLAKIGINVGIIGKVGDDGFGDFLISLMKSEGVKTEGVKRSPEVNTSSTVVLVDPDGERSFLHYSGANAKLRIEDIDFEIIKRAKILHLAPIGLLPSLDGKPAAEILRKGKKIGLLTSLDIAWDAKGKWLSLVKPSLKYVDIFLPNFEEAEMISGKETSKDIANFFLGYGIKIVGLKMGEKGCYLKTKETELKIPAFPAKAADTTGAGDGFVAGFLTGIVKGWDLKKNGIFANAVGACIVGKIGASTGVKNFQETIEFISNQESL
ncbi:MAG: carbohydrate kinase family protein [bacterium]